MGARYWCDVTRMLDETLGYTLRVTGLGGLGCFLCLRRFVLVVCLRACVAWPGLFS